MFCRTSESTLRCNATPSPPPQAEPSYVYKIHIDSLLSARPIWILYYWRELRTLRTVSDEKSLYHWYQLNWNMNHVAWNYTIIIHLIKIMSNLPVLVHIFENFSKMNTVTPHFFYIKMISKIFYIFWENLKKSMKNYLLPKWSYIFVNISKGKSLLKVFSRENESRDSHFSWHFRNL